MSMQEAPCRKHDAGSTIRVVSVKDEGEKERKRKWQTFRKCDVSRGQQRCCEELLKDH